MEPTRGFRAAQWWYSSLAVPVAFWSILNAQSAVSAEKRGAMDTDSDTDTDMVDDTKRSRNRTDKAPKLRWDAQKSSYQQWWYEMVSVLLVCNLGPTQEGTNRAWRPPQMRRRGGNMPH